MLHRIILILLVFCLPFIMGVTTCDPSEVWDKDLDGIDNRSDNCINTYNPEQEDRDNDWVGDACDNCIDEFNSEQFDTDGDGIGDACDAYTCKTLDPTAYGDCDMLLGIAFDGEKCVYISGCGCGQDCGYIFPDFESCEKACFSSNP